MHRKFRDVLDGLKDGGADALERVLSEEGYPLVHHREVLLLFHDGGRPVRSVRLVHHVATMDRAPAFTQLTPDGPFSLHLILPAGARLEYTFGIKYVDGGEEIRTDPLNPEQALCPYGPKSVVTAGDYRRPDWCARRNGGPCGRIEEHSLESRELKGSRHIWVRQPMASPPPEGYPVLIVHDGNDYLNFAGLAEVLDNLEEQQLVEPFLTVFTKPYLRNHEYTCTPEHPTYLARELLPWLSERYSVDRRRERTGLMGASFGAVASLYAAHLHPDRFGLLLLQSGSFRYHHVVRTSDRIEMIDELDRITLFLEQEFFPEGPRQPMRIFHSCGTFESILSYNRNLARMMGRLDHEYRYRESHDGHNWIAWRDHLGEGLAYLFPLQEQGAQ